jgi:protein-S-isoprenylcysteine O-methyltransferase Ste14
MWPEEAIFYPWDVWIVSWIVAALWVNRTMKRPAIGSEWSYRLLEWGGFAVLLGIRSQTSDAFRAGVVASNPFLQRYWALPPDAGWVMVGLATFGFLFAWWARIHLGRLWSGRITRKEDHRIVDSGPYRFVRHPIYTGILLALFGTALAVGEWRGLLGVVLAGAAYWRKLKIEEAVMRRQFGETYSEYAAHVPALIPFLL